MGYYFKSPFVPVLESRLCVSFGARVSVGNPMGVT